MTVKEKNPNISHITTVQYSTWKVYILTFRWMSLATNDLPKHRCRSSTPRQHWFPQPVNGCHLSTKTAQCRPGLKLPRSESDRASCKDFNQFLILIINISELLPVPVVWTSHRTPEHQDRHSSLRAQILRRIQQSERRRWKALFIHFRTLCHSENKQSYKKEIKRHINKYLKKKKKKRRGAVRVL